MLSRLYLKNGEIIYFSVSQATESAASSFTSHPK